MQESEYVCMCVHVRGLSLPQATATQRQSLESAPYDKR